MPQTADLQAVVDLQHGGSKSAVALTLFGCERSAFCVPAPAKVSRLSLASSSSSWVCARTSAAKARHPTWHRVVVYSTPPSSSRRADISQASRSSCAVPHAHHSLLVLYLPCAYPSCLAYPTICFLHFARKQGPHIVTYTIPRY